MLLSGFQKPLSFAFKNMNLTKIMSTFLWFTLFHVLYFTFTNIELLWKTFHNTCHLRLKNEFNKNYVNLFFWAIFLSHQHVETDPMSSNTLLRSKNNKNKFWNFSLGSFIFVFWEINELKSVEASLMWSLIMLSLDRCDSSDTEQFGNITVNHQ